VALGALSAGATAGVGAAFGGPLAGNIQGFDRFAAFAQRAAVSSIVTQGIGVVTGVQKSFDWRGVAASAVGAGVSGVVNSALNSLGAFGDLGKFGTALARGTVSGFAGGLTTGALHAGRISVQQIAIDSFGNALGSSIAVGMNGSGDTGATWAADVSERKRSLDPLGLQAYANDVSGVMRSAQTLWGAPPVEATSGLLSDTSTNAEIMDSRMAANGQDGELMPTGGNVRVSPATGGRPAMVNGVSVNQRVNNALQATGDLAGIGDVYRDYKLLGGLLSEVQQQATIDRLKGTIQDKLGMMRVLPTPEAMGAVPGIGSDGSIRYNKVDLIDRYSDALRKVEMWKQGIIELDTRSMLITSIGTAKLSPADWVAENTRRYTNAFAVGMDEGQRHYDAGTLRYPADMPGQLQVGSFADRLARDAVISYNRSIGVPEGPGQLLSMNRWSYDPSGNGAYNRIDLLMDLGPSRNNGALILRTAIEGKASLGAVQSSGGQLQRVYDWVTPKIKTVTPQGILPWTPQPKRLR
jgi:hypothetical protein